MGRGALCCAVISVCNDRFVERGKIDSVEMLLY